LGAVLLELAGQLIEVVHRSQSPVVTRPTIVEAIM
jgi:hypothetical protein